MKIQQPHPLSGASLCRITASVTILSLASCTVLDNTAMSTAIGASGGAILGSAVAGSNSRVSGGTIGGLVGGAAGYVISQSYQASQEQKMIAEQEGERAYNDAKVRKSKARYVAVPVKKKQGKGQDLMVYDTKTKKLDSDKAYVPDSDTSCNKGDEVTVGGKRAVVAKAFQGV